MNNTDDPTVEKVKFFDDPIKKLAVIAILFLAMLSLEDLNVLFREIPAYGQLNTSIGKIKIDKPSVRVGRIFNLVINKQKIPFSCSFSESRDRTCVATEIPFFKYQDKVDELLKYQGKISKVWWFKGNNIVGEEIPRLYQLEVDGKIIISYQEQIESHRYSKEGYFPSWIAWLVFIVGCFVKYLLKVT